MILIALRFVVVPDGCLLAVGVPRMFTVLQKSIEDWFVLPLVIRATEHKRILYPDANTGEVEACVNEGFPEGETFGIRMEAVGGTAFFEVVGHVLECGKQEVVKLLAL